MSVPVRQAKSMADTSCRRGTGASYPLGQFSENFRNHARVLREGAACANGLHLTLFLARAR